jgi:hypothetical protein
MEIINNITLHHPQNRLKAHVEFSGHAKEKPLSYSTIEKTFFSTFIRKDPFFTPMNLRLEIGENPREKQQLVELMNIIAEEIFEGQYDFDLGTDKVEEKIRKGENIPDGHLRATRSPTLLWSFSVKPFCYRKKQSKKLGKVPSLKELEDRYA